MALFVLILCRKIYCRSVGVFLITVHHLVVFGNKNIKISELKFANCVTLLHDDVVIYFNFMWLLKCIQFRSFIKDV